MFSAQTEANNKPTYLKSTEKNNTETRSRDEEIAYLRETIDRERETRRLYDEGKDELIFELEQKLSQVAEELAKEKNKPQSNDFIREQVTSLSKEIESLRNQIASKDVLISDIERKYKVASELLEGESNNWKFLLDEKDAQAEDLKKQLNELLTERKQWAQFETVKNDLMREAEERVSQAIIALEQERSHRAQFEGLHDRMSKSYKEAVETIQKLEKELEAKTTSLTQLESELKKSRHLSQVEKESWQKEKAILLEKAKESGEVFSLRDQMQILQSNLHSRNKEIEVLLFEACFNFDKKLKEEVSSLEKEKNTEKTTVSSLKQMEAENQRVVSVLTKDVASLKEQLQQSEDQLKKAQEQQVVQVEEMKQQLRDVITKTRMFEQELLFSVSQESKALVTFFC